MHDTERLFTGCRVQGGEPLCESGGEQQEGGEAEGRLSHAHPPPGWRPRRGQFPSVRWIRPDPHLIIWPFPGRIYKEILVLIIFL